LSKLQESSFCQSFADKGRLSSVLSNIPIAVVLNEDAPLLGAGHQALATVSPSKRRQHEILFELHPERNGLTRLEILQNRKNNKWCRGWESNPHEEKSPEDFKSSASAIPPPGPGRYKKVACMKPSLNVCGTARLAAAGPSCRSSP